MDRNTAEVPVETHKQVPLVYPLPVIRSFVMTLHETFPPESEKKRTRKARPLSALLHIAALLRSIPFWPAPLILLHPRKKKEESECLPDGCVARLVYDYFCTPSPFLLLPSSLFLFHLALEKVLVYASDDEEGDDEETSQEKTDPHEEGLASSSNTSLALLLPLSVSSYEKEAVRSHPLRSCPPAPRMGSTANVSVCEAPLWDFGGGQTIYQ